MNAKEFDIEKLIKEDVKSIEIDRDFKARLKANIMKNDTSSAEKVVNLKDAKDKRGHWGRDNKKLNVRRYLKIASSFAIVGIFGVQFALNGLPGAMARADREIEGANKLVITGSQVYSIDDLKVNTGNDEKVHTGEGKKEVIKEEKIKEKKIKENKTEGASEVVKTKEQQTKPEEKENATNVAETEEKPNATEGEKVPESEAIKTEVEEVDSNETGEESAPIDNGSSEEEIPVEVATTESDNTESVVDEESNGLYDSRAITDSEIDEDLIKNTEKVNLSANVDSEVVDIDILDDEILLDYAKQNGIEFYFGELNSLKEKEFEVQENTISMKVNENSNEVIYNSKDDKNVLGIKSIGNSLIAVIGSDDGKYDLIKIDIKSKEAKELFVDCQNLIFNSDFSYAAFEKNGAVKIVKLDNEEVISRVGNSVAWSPDGQFVSYLKSEVTQNEEGKKQTTSIIAAYNVIDKTETKVLKSELIDKSEDEVMSRYNYGKHLWEKNGKCIYLIREDMNIITENDLEKIIVNKIIFE